MFAPCARPVDVRVVYPRAGVWSRVVLKALLVSNVVGPAAVLVDNEEAADAVLAIRRTVVWCRWNVDQVAAGRWADVAERCLQASGSVRVGVAAEIVASSGGGWNRMSTGVDESSDWLTLRGR